MKVAKQLRRSKRELREDKAERVGKNEILQEGMRPMGGSGEGLGSGGPEQQSEADDKALLQASRNHP
jgi:hypothetical protein